MNIVGLRWDEYTPQIEGQLTRDLIALQSTFETSNPNSKIQVVTDKNDADSLFYALGIERGGDDETLAKVWVIYRSNAEAEVEAPENARDVTVRDMYQEHKDTTINPNPESGYYLKPQGRIGRPRLSMLPYPTHKGQASPAIVLLWG